MSTVVSADKRGSVQCFRRFTREIFHIKVHLFFPPIKLVKSPFKTAALDVPGKV